ncbi:ATP synthase subunit I [Fictibacillus enclensis]|uniref:ATP synthase subunit I n=1 Tax=Fictibacillus enclensis TaxID=1017270 RepID=UPI00259FF802|nr:ATP synthase subunit I [Fictibacillus enclensis]MDM5201377.1 ATP synthase subunit I [Fictibacillus enclensis]MDM5340791.1 ATP synthase subunit I [Fictibacillus enclensis]
MTEYTMTFRRYIKITLFMLSFFVLGYGVTSYQSIFLGLSFGTLFSLYNLWSMYSRIERLGQAVINQQKVRTMGSLSRLLVGGLAVLIAMRYPQFFNLLSVVIGLMTVYIIMLIDSLTKTIRTSKEKR